MQYQYFGGSVIVFETILQILGTRLYTLSDLAEARVSSQRVLLSPTITRVAISRSTRRAPPRDVRQLGHVLAGAELAQDREGHGDLSRRQSVAPNRD